VIRVPPLRDRLSDVEPLVRHFLALTAKRFGSREKGITDEALAALKEHDWRRNNVRELRNAVERMVIASPGETVGVDAVPRELGSGAAGTPDAARSDDAVLSAPATLRDAKAAAERIIVLRALERNDWHVTNTAADLGLADHASLSKIMKRHGLRKNR